MANITSRGYIFAVILCVAIIIPTFYYGIKFIRYDIELADGSVEEFESGIGFMINNDLGSSKFIGILFLFLGAIFSFIAISSVFQMQSKNYYRFA
ncbi:MAG: hypothetical protein FK731_01395 [Asgard group archaeon]|nr:hypothetical protein [Asgard group archaeon]